MIQVLPETENDLLAVKVSGKLSAGDFDTYRELCRQKMQTYGSVRLYFEMESFHGWETSTFIENAIFDLIHGRQYGRVAMVGDKQWQEWTARAASPVKKKGIKYFDLADKAIALQWVMADPDKRGSAMSTDI